MPVSKLRIITATLTVFFFLFLGACTVENSAFSGAQTDDVGTGENSQSSDTGNEDDASSLADTNGQVPGQDVGGGEDPEDVGQGDDVGGEADVGGTGDVPLYVGSDTPYEPGSLAVETVQINGAPVELLAFVPDGEYTFGVVVFQHGFLMANTHYSTLLEHIASHGFVVLAPQMYEAGGLPWGKPTAAEEAVLATDLYDWIAADLSDNIDAVVDANLVGLVGHSRGAKVIWLSLSDSPRTVQALAGVDPVDGQGGPLGGEDRALDNPPTIDAPVVVIGSGLGPESSGIWQPACAPEGDNYVQFYAAVSSPAWQVVVPDFGHLDILDDNPSGCAMECDACIDGPQREPMRTVTAAMLVALFRGTLQGDASAHAWLDDVQAAPVTIVVESK